MDPNKCFLLSFAFLQVFVSNLAKSISKQNIYKKVFFNQDHNECVCFEQNHDLVSVPQHLDPENNEIERLIIILYRTKQGTIYTYIPNRIKQSVLPDLQYEADDSITNISDETLYTLFVNSNKSIKYPWPGYKPVKEEVKENNYFPSHKPVMKDHSNKPVVCLNKAKDKGKGPSECIKINKYGDIGTIPSKNIFEKINENLLPNSLEQPENEKENPLHVTTILPHPISKLNETNHLGPFSPTDILKINHTVSENFDGSFNKWFTDQIKNIDSVNSTHQSINFEALQQLILNALKKQGVLVSSSGILTDTHGNVLNITNLYLRPLLIGESIKYSSIKPNPNGSYALAEISPYMESVLIAVLDPPKIVAIIPIGQVKVPKSLDFRHVFYHGIVRRNNRDESDDAVKLLSSENDFSPTHTHLLKEKYIPLKNNINVLRNMILKEKYTPLRGNIKVLGNKMPSEEDVEIENDNIVSEDINKERIANVTSLYLPPIETHIEPKDVIKEHVAGDISSYVPSMETGMELNGALRDRIADNISPYLLPIETRTESISEGKEQIINKVPAYIHPGVLKDTESPHNEVEVDDVDDSFDFRIIGGAAATGSGVPISNRGRSGILIPNK